MYTFFLILFGFVCLLLILIVLLQSSRASGMELFGSSQNIFGAQSGDILTKTTTVLAVIFLAGSFGFAVYQSSKQSMVEKKIQEMRTTPQQQPQQQETAEPKLEDNIIQTDKQSTKPTLPELPTEK